MAGAGLQHSSGDSADDTDKTRTRGFGGSKREHPLTKSSFFSQLYWLWLWPLLLYGRKNDITADDIWELPERDHGDRLLASYKSWRARNRGRRINLWHLLAAKFWKRWLIAAGLYVIWCTSAGLQPFLVKRIVAFLEDDTKPVREGVYLSVGLGVCTTIYALAINHKFHQLFRNGVRMRGMLMTIMFQKALTIAMSTDQNVGSVTNMMSNDTERLFEMQILFHYLWASPLFVVVMLILLALDIGPAAIVGFGLLLLVIPVQARLGGYVGRKKGEMLATTDERTNLMSQVITGMNVIKLYSWELPFAQRLTQLRDQEVQLLSRIQYVRALMRTVLYVAPSVVGAVTLAVYVALGNDLTLETTFSTLSYINIVRFPMLLIPNSYALLGEGRASIRRITTYLEQSDTPACDGGDSGDGGDDDEGDDVVDGGRRDDDSDGKAAEAETEDEDGVEWSDSHGKTCHHDRSDESKGCTASKRGSHVHDDGTVVLGNEVYWWHQKRCDVSINITNDANASARASMAETPHAIAYTPLTIPAGSLVTVVGRVGSGKTAFLLSLLGELWRHDNNNNSSGAGGSVRKGDGHSKRPQQAARADANNTTANHSNSNSSTNANINMNNSATVTSDVSRRACARRRPKMCYAQQSHVIFNLTLRENVLFGAPFDAAKFKFAVTAACLDRDIALLPHGTETEIGENGVNLSGGQKARVAFARCIYHSFDANTILLDDPLSSVDIHVASDMFRNGIQGALAGKTRFVVMSSHQDLAKEADVVLTIEDGRIAHVKWRRTGADGDSGGDGVKLQREDGADVDIAAPAACCVGATNNTDSNSIDDSVAGKPASTPAAAKTSTPAAATTAATAAAAANEGLTVLEEKERGAVSWAVYKAYAAAASVSSWTYDPEQLSTRDRSERGGYAWLQRPREWGGVVIFAVLFVYVFGQCVRVMADVWLTWWATDADPQSEDLPPDLRNHTTAFWTQSLFIWVASNVVVAVLRSFFCTYLAMRSSRAIHFHALLRLLHAPMAYFHSNPPGRLLNRFSTDLHRVDMLLPDFLFQFLDNIFVLLTAMALAVVSVPWLLILIAPLLLATYFIQNTYRSTSRELLRIEAITKSPIYSLFSQVLSSRVSVRAFRVAKHMTAKVHATIDHHLKIFLINKLLERWMSITFNGLATAVGTVLCLVAVHIRDDVDASLIGLALVYCLQLMGLTSWTVKMFIEVENNMTSLERIREVEGLPLEIPREHIDTSTSHHSKEGDEAPAPVLPPHWPTKGSVDFKDVVLRYRPHLPPALKHFNLHIRAGEKLGICGRTGAGKSTIISALFRLFPCEAGGRIELDGVNLFDLPLHVARRSLAIIPQDPVLLNGTVRQNLDPLAMHTDEEIWKALADVNLSSYLQTRFGDGVLDMAVGEGDGGVVFSHGQRQLLCIARALLRESRVLVCDEATSSVDQETDLMIQRVLTQVFCDRTVVIIAHRLDTILTCDRVLVMDAGEAVEIGEPKTLLAQPSSRFRRMVEQLQREAVEETLAASTDNTGGGGDVVKEGVHGGHGSDDVSDVVDMDAVWRDAGDNNNSYNNSYNTAATDGDGGSLSFVQRRGDESDDDPNISVV